MFKTFMLISCIIVLSFQLGKATRPLIPQAYDPQKYAQTATKAAVCGTEFWTYLGRPSVACCKALEEIDDSCLPSLFRVNPFIAQIIKSVCSRRTGGGGSSGSGTFPFPPFTFPFPIPFPPVGGGSGSLPFPFPFPPISGGRGGSGGLPFPFPFPPIGGGSGSGGFPFPFPGIGGGASPPPPSPPSPSKEK